MAGRRPYPFKKYLSPECCRDSIWRSPPQPVARCRRGRRTHRRLPRGPQLALKNLAGLNHQVPDLLLAPPPLLLQRRLTGARRQGSPAAGQGSRWGHHRWHGEAISLITPFADDPLPTTNPPMISPRCGCSPAASSPPPPWIRQLGRYSSPPLFLGSDPREGEEEGGWGEM